MTSEQLLMEHKVCEYGGLIFIEPHAQFPVAILNQGEQQLQPQWHKHAAGDPQVIRFLELYGRCCYKSEERITPESAAKFMKMIIKSGHESVLEHVNLTVKYVGSRAMSHQLVRHRIAAYSQESQRYCNYGKDEKLYVVAPPSTRVVKTGNVAIQTEFQNAILNAYDSYKYLLSQDLNPEDARFVLPNACKTEVVVTFNIRQWRHVIEHRGLNPKAQWEIREITLQVLKEFKRVYPELFGDLFKRI